MKELFDIIDFSIVIQLVTVLALFLFIRYGKGRVKPDLYDDVKLAVVVSGTLFRNDKIKLMSDIVYKAVSTIEQLDRSNEEKHQIAMEEATKEIAKTLNVDVDKELINKMVQVAVSHLPKTKK